MRALPGIVAGGLNAAAGQLRAHGFKAAHVVALPAVQGDRDLGEFLHGGIDVHAKSGILFFGDLVRLCNLLVFHLATASSLRTPYPTWLVGAPRNNHCTLCMGRLVSYIQ